MKIIILFLFQKGLVLGVFEGCKEGELKFSATGRKFDEESGGKLSELIKGLARLLIS